MSDENAAATPRRPVVLIEDDQFIANALGELLQFHGYEVTIVSTLRDAAAATAAIDGRCLVLLDPLVPSVTPNGVLAALRDGQLLITMAMAVFPGSGGRGGKPSLKTPEKQVISPALLLEMIHDAFEEDGERGEQRLAA